MVYAQCRRRARTQVEVEIIREELVPWENIVQVPVERVAYVDHELRVPVQRSLPHQPREASILPYLTTNALLLQPPEPPLVFLPTGGSSGAASTSLKSSCQATGIVLDCTIDWYEFWGL